MLTVATPPAGSPTVSPCRPNRAPAAVGGTGTVLRYAVSIASQYLVPAHLHHVEVVGDGQQHRAVVVYPAEYSTGYRLTGSTALQYSW